MEAIKTNRLLLRLIRADDTFNVYSYAHDESITMMMFYPHKSLEETREYIENALREYASDAPCDIDYIIEYGGKVAGMAGISYCGNAEAELGWLIGSAYRGMGFATEAAKALISEGRRNGIKRFFARCDGRNAASERVMQKLGMTLIDEGTRTYPRTGETAPEKTYELIIK